MQLQAAGLKGWTTEEVKAVLSMEIGSRGLQFIDDDNTLPLNIEGIYYSSPAGVLYEQALQHEAVSAIVDSGGTAVEAARK